MTKEQLTQAIKNVVATKQPIALENVQFTPTVVDGKLISFTIDFWKNGNHYRLELSEPTNGINEINDHAIKNIIRKMRKRDAKFSFDCPFLYPVALKP